MKRYFIIMTDFMEWASIEAPRGEWVLWEDVELELDLKDSEIAKLEARIEELEMDITDLRGGD